MGEHKSILIVEDTPELLETLRHLLEGHGYVVTAATDAHSALQALHSKQPFDLLLTDLFLPDMSGEDLIETARLMVAGLRAMVMSGGKASNLAPDIIQLQKPFSGKELLAKLREMGLQSSTHDK